MDLLSDFAIEPKLAPIGYRIGAALIDFMILSVITIIISHFWGENYSTNDSVGFRVAGLPALALFAIDIGLICILEGVTGKTIGKRIAKIKVVKEDFSPASVGLSIVRHLFDVVDMFFVVGLIVAASNPRRQRIGDLVAKTVVVMD